MKLSEKGRVLISSIRARFGRFEDGSSITRISREEYLYKKADGHTASVYVFIILNDEVISRSLEISSVEKWVEPNRDEPISTQEQREIIEKFRRYFRAFHEEMNAQ